MVDPIQGVVQGADIASGDFTFTSADGATPIHCRFWLPPNGRSTAPRALVQIAHGMEEYIGRYDDFARFLASEGFAVCGNDHIGHGQSVTAPERLSILPVGGAEIMLADMHALRTQFTVQFPAGIPYVFFGHSMGSFALRCYLARHGSGLAGAVVCGTGQVPGIATSFGGFLARFIASRKGIEAHSPFINSLADGAYAKKIDGARTPLDWLNTDPAKVDEYVADPLCGVQFSVGGYATLMDLTREACRIQSAAAVPDGLPMLFIAGALDPVGDCGKGVKAAYENYARGSKARVQLKLYEGMRHEILNEPEHGRVYRDVLAWIEHECLGEGGRTDG